MVLNKDAKTKICNWHKLQYMSLRDFEKTVTAIMNGRITYQLIRRRK